MPVKIPDVWLRRPLQFPSCNSSTHYTGGTSDTEPRREGISGCYIASLSSA